MEEEEQEQEGAQEEEEEEEGVQMVGGLEEERRRVELEEVNLIERYNREEQGARERTGKGAKSE